jgi:hypothetical protein
MRQINVKQWFVFVLLFFLTPYSFADAGDELSAYINSFGSVEELLQEYESIGVLSAADHNEILVFLKEQEVDIQSSLPAVRWFKDKLTVTDKMTAQAIGYKFESQGIYRTLDGRVVKVGHLRNGYEIYKNMFLALSQRNSVSKFSFIISSAQATPPTSRVNPSIGAGAFLLEHSLRLAGTATNSLEVAFYGIIGGFASTAWPYRHFFVDGKVACDGPRYTVVDGFNPQTKAYLAIDGPAKDCADFEKEKTYWFASESENLCKFVIRVRSFMWDSIEGTPNKVYVKDGKLEKILKANPAPSCNETRAATVEAALKAELKSMAGFKRTTKSGSEISVRGTK